MSWSPDHTKRRKNLWILTSLGMCIKAIASQVESTFVTPFRSQTYLFAGFTRAFLPFGCLLGTTRSFPYLCQTPARASLGLPALTGPLVLAWGRLLLWSPLQNPGCCPSSPLFPGSTITTVPFCITQPLLVFSVQLTRFRSRQCHLSPCYIFFLSFGRFCFLGPITLSLFLSFRRSPPRKHTQTRPGGPGVLPLQSFLHQALCHSPSYLGIFHPPSTRGRSPVLVSDSRGSYPPTHPTHPPHSHRPTFTNTRIHITNLCPVNLPHISCFGFPGRDETPFTSQAGQALAPTPEGPPRR